MVVTLKRGVASFVLALALGGATAGTSALDDLRWLEGTWVRETGRGTQFETWRVLNAHTFEGESYFVDATGGGKTVTESLLLAEMGGEVFYISRPSENPYPVGFKLVEMKKDSATFENPTHDFPTKIHYVKNADGSLTASIEGPIEGQEQPRRIDFHFTRGD
jgi:hypothetical protein